MANLIESQMHPNQRIEDYIKKLMFSTGQTPPKNQAPKKYQVARKIDFSLKEIGTKKSSPKKSLTKKSIEEEYNSEITN
jgi:hypothetical protein